MTIDLVCTAYIINCEMSGEMKKTYIVLLLAATVLLCLTSCSKNNDGQNVIATVNGEEVTQAELSYFEGRLRAEVYAENASGDTDESVLALRLRERALNECIRAKIILVLCRDNGLYSDITYEGLEALAVSYNEAHSGDSGAVGLNTIQMSQFYTYYIDSGELELQSLLADTVLSPTQEELSSAQVKLSGTLSGDELTAAAKKRAVAVNFDEYITSLINEAEITTDGGIIK